MPKKVGVRTVELTLKELKEALKTLPPEDILELLEISSEDLVNKFEDRIDNDLLRQSDS